MNIMPLSEFGKAFVPKKIRPNLRRYYLKAGITDIPYTFFGILFMFTGLITLAIYIAFIFPFASKYNPLILLFGTFISWFVIQIILAIFAMSVVYFYIDLRIFTRTKRMEEVLPDFLQVVSSNLKGGMNFERALWSSINPRFDVLAEEIGIAAKKVMTGEDVQMALFEFMEKYDSSTLRRSMELIINEIEEGGKISGIIDKVVENLNQTKDLRDEMNASVLNYVIFISAIVIAVAPGLFALSLNLLKIISGFTAKLAMGNVASAAISVPFSVGGFSIKPELFRNFSYASLSVIAIFSSMIVSLIQKGSIKGGIKFIPLFLAFTLLVYMIALKVLSSMFSGIVF